MKEYFNEGTPFMSMESESNEGSPPVSGGPLFTFLDYEIRSSWWASLISWEWGQNLAGKYFAWKAIRKYTRYKKSKMWKQRVKGCR